MQPEYNQTVTDPSLKGLMATVNPISGNKVKKASGRRRYVGEEQRRSDILKAAIKVFGEKGYHNAKMQEIAARAGVANGTVYRYFPSKFQLATELIGARGASGFIESLRETNAEKLAPEQFLMTTAKKYFGHQKDLPLIRFRISEALANPDLGHQYYVNLLHRLIGDIASFIEPYQKKKLIKSFDPFVLGHIFYGILFGFLYCQELMFGKETTGIDINKLAKTVVEVFLHGAAADTPKDR